MSMTNRARSKFDVGRTRLSGISLLSAAIAVAAPPAAAAGFVQTNLVSDLPGVAAVTDSNLVNPWGIASSASSPFWVSDNGTGVSTLYNGAGQPFPLGTPLVVSIPALGGGPGAPTGVVANPTSDFALTNGNKAQFLFATEGGTIAGWNGASGTTAEIDAAIPGAIYKGLAIANSASGNRIYATNFHAGTVDVFDSGFAPVSAPGGFADPTLPAGFAPFGIQELGGSLYVTYAKQDAAGEDDVAGPGFGFVDVFDANGVLNRRLISNGSLNSPWGLALAPAGFGPFGGDLLVGNFGDGAVNAFDPLTGALEGTLSDPDGNPITIQGLWGLRFGNGGNGGDPGTLYFAAGIPGPGGAVEDHGLFGSLAFAAPEPAALALVIPGLAVLSFWRRRRVTPSKNEPPVPDRYIAVQDPQLLPREGR
jgi:uncharacterized protein (TIGR03118 family)